MKIILFSLTILTLCAGAHAQANTRDALVREITALAGIDEMVRSAKETSTKRVHESVSKLLSQAKSGMPGLSEDSWNAIQAAARKMIDRVVNSWDVEDAIQ